MGLAVLFGSAAGPIAIGGRAEARPRLQTPGRPTQRALQKMHSRGAYYEHTLPGKMWNAISDKFSLVRSRVHMNEWVHRIRSTPMMRKFSIPRASRNRTRTILDHLLNR